MKDARHFPKNRWTYVSRNKKLHVSSLWNRIHAISLRNPYRIRTLSPIVSVPSLPSLHSSSSSYDSSTWRLRWRNFFRAHTDISPVGNVIRRNS